MSKEPEGSNESAELEQVAQDPNIEAVDVVGASDDAGRDDGPVSEGREAAKWRRKLREAETARDELASELDGLRAQLANSVVAEVLEKPESFWMTGAKMADYFTGSMLDRDKLHHDAHAAASSSGLVTKATTVISSPTASREGAIEHAGAAWSSAFGPKR